MLVFISLFIGCGEKDEDSAVEVVEETQEDTSVEDTAVSEPEDTAEVEDTAEDTAESSDTAQ